MIDFAAKIGNFSSILFTCAAILLLYFLKKSSNSNKRNIPRLGLIYSLKNVRNPVRGITKVANETKAQLIEANIGLGKVVLATHPDTVQELLGKDVQNFRKAVFRIPSQELTASSLLMQNGDIWKKQRTIMSPSFHFDSLSNFCPIFHEKVTTLFQQWDKQDCLEDLDVVHWMGKFTLDVLGVTVFGTEFNSILGCNNAYEAAFHDVRSFGKYQAMMNMIPGIWKLKFLWRGLANAIDAANKMTTQIIERKIQERKDQVEGKRPDLLDALLDHFCDLSMEELTDNVWLFFVAGHETTATALSFAMYYFGKYPEYQKLAREEVDKVLGKNIPNHENVKDLQFLDLYIKEVMRISPPVNVIFSRKPIKDMYIGDNLIHKDERVTVSIATIHQLEEFWPDPTKFDPYRFTPENSKNRHPYAYLPFSLGRRHCIGNNFSLLEQKIYLATLLQNYTVHYTNEAIPGRRIVTNPPESVRVTLRHRKDNC